MAFGPGKYDDVCTEIRTKTNAQGVVVIILKGNKGDGFSMQADPVTTAALPEMLESIARQIRADLKKWKL